MLPFSTAAMAVALAPPPPGGPLVCSGTEPFWVLRLGSERWAIERPSSVLGAPDERTALLPVAPRPAQNRRPGHVRVYETKTESGARVTIVVRRQACSDGMSDRSYGHWVLLATDEQVLEGCCDPPGAWPGR